MALLFDDLLIAKYGYEKILTRLIHDLKVLETVGILIDGLLIRGTISYICADSLGANSIFGLVESFDVNVTGFCRFCYGNDDDANIQTHFNDTDFLERTIKDHADDVYFSQLTN